MVTFCEVCFFGALYVCIYLSRASFSATITARPRQTTLRYMRTGRRRRPQDAVTVTAKHKTNLSINQTFFGKQCDRCAIRPSLSGRGHEKTRSEIDWNRIMTPDGNGQAPPDDDDDDGGDSPGLSSVRRTIKKKPDKMHE